MQADRSSAHLHAHSTMGYLSVHQQNHQGHKSSSKKDNIHYQVSHHLPNRRFFASSPTIHSPCLRTSVLYVIIIWVVLVSGQTSDRFDCFGRTQIIHGLAMRVLLLAYDIEIFIVCPKSWKCRYHNYYYYYQYNVLNLFTWSFFSVHLLIFSYHSMFIRPATIWN